MWLLDVNLPNGLIGFLRNQKIDCETTVARGWRNLENGVLASAASNAGFKVILTRDRLFGETAAKALHLYPGLSVVIVRITQSKKSTYLKQFETAWIANPIKPVPGAIVEWP